MLHTLITLRESTLNMRKPRGNAYTSNVSVLVYFKSSLIRFRSSLDFLREKAIVVKLAISLVVHILEKMAVELETVLIFGFAFFMCQFTRGLTAFGSSLTSFSVWTIFSALGYNVATLKVVVVCNLLINIAGSIPFLFLTKVCIYGDYGLLAPICIPKAFTFILGTYLLKKVSEQLLQVILAPVLIFLVLIRYVELLYKYYKNKKQGRGQLQNQDKESECEKSHDNKDLSQSLLTQDEAVVKSFPIIVIDKEEDKKINCSSNSSSSLLDAQQNEQNNTEKRMDFEEEMGFCFETGKMTSECTSFHCQALAYLFTCRCTSGMVEKTRGYYTDFAIKQDRLLVRYCPKWLRDLPWLLSASVIAGVMQGWLSLQGPPLMYTYQYLQIPKNVVRASMSVESLFNPGLIIYIVFGLFYPEYITVYITIICTGLAGITIGSYFAQYISTKIYYHILMLIMLGSAVVLLLKGLSVGGV